MSDLIPCQSCNVLMAPAEVWKGQLCRLCALTQNPAACETCKGHGTVYVPELDSRRHLTRKLAVCPECGGREEHEPCAPTND